MLVLCIPEEGHVTVHEPMLIDEWAEEFCRIIMDYFEEREEAYDLIRYGFELDVVTGEPICLT